MFVYFQECATLEGSKLGLQNRLAEQESSLTQLKQNLVRTTLVKQTLEFEKNELLRRVQELEKAQSDNLEKDKQKQPSFVSHKNVRFLN